MAMEYRLRSTIRAVVVCAWSCSVDRLSTLRQGVQDIPLISGMMEVLREPAIQL